MCVFLSWFVKWSDCHELLRTLSSAQKSWMILQFMSYSPVFLFQNPERWMFYITLFILYSFIIDMPDAVYLSNIPIFLFLIVALHNVTLSVYISIAFRAFYWLFWDHKPQSLWYNITDTVWYQHWAFTDRNKVTVCFNLPHHYQT